MKINPDGFRIPHDPAQTLEGLINEIKITDRGILIEDVRITDLATTSNNDCGNGIYIFYAGDLITREFLYIGSARSQSFAVRISNHFDQREDYRTMGGILTRMVKLHNLDAEEFPKAKAFNLLTNRNVKLLLLTFPPSKLEEHTTKSGRTTHPLTSKAVKLERFLIWELWIANQRAGSNPAAYLAKRLDDRI